MQDCVELSSAVGLELGSRFVRVWLVYYHCCRKSEDFRSKQISMFLTRNGGNGGWNIDEH